MLETEKVAKKIESILSHSEMSLGINSEQKSLMLEAFVKRSFTKQQLQMNVYNSQMMIKFLEFFPVVNQVSTVREKIRETNLDDSEDSFDYLDMED